MSNLTKKFELFNGLNREDGHAIVSLIDQKTESDMDKVLNKLDLMFTTFDTRLNSMEERLDSMEKNFDVKFDSFEKRLVSIEKSVNSRLDSMGKSVDDRLGALNSRINTLYWFIGIAITIATMAVRYLTH